MFSFPFVTSQCHNDFVRPLTFDKLVLDKASFLVESRFLKRANRRGVSPVAPADYAVQVVLLEGEHE